MTVSDKRRPPFAWIALDALDAIRDRLPPDRHKGARDTLLALAEAASRRHDGTHKSGHPLKRLLEFCTVSERRLRDHLDDLEMIGLIEVKREVDHAGRTLPKRYALQDAGVVTTANRVDNSQDDQTDTATTPTRASDVGLQEVEETPPNPPGARRRRRHQPPPATTSDLAAAFGKRRG